MVSDIEKALVMIYRGHGYYYYEIANELSLSEYQVGKIAREIEKNGRKNGVVGSHNEIMMNALVDELSGMDDFTEEQARTLVKTFLEQATN